jgi:hypothetical protein
VELSDEAYFTVQKVRYLPKTFAVLKYLFYRNNTMRRVKYEWSDAECRRHEDCKCDLTVTITDPRFNNFSFTLRRTDYEHYADKDMMLVRALAKIAASYALVSGTVIPISKREDWEYVRIMFSSQSYANMMKIPPLFYKNSGTTDQELPHPGYHVAEGMKIWDASVMSRLGKHCTVDYLEKLGIFKRSVILDEPGRGWNDAKAETEAIYQNGPAMTGIHTHDSPAIENKPLFLSHQVIANLSAYNRVFTGGQYGQYQRCTLEKLNGEKLVMGLKKMDQPTNSFNKVGKTVAPFLRPALNRMYSMMGVDKHFKAYTYDPDMDVFFGMPLMSSAGSRAGPTKMHHHEGVSFVHTVNGKKKDQLSFAQSEYQTLLDCAKRGELYKRTTIGFTAVQKMETLNDFDSHTAASNARFDLENPVPKAVNTKVGSSKPIDTRMVDQLERDVRELKMKYRNYILPFISDYAIHAHVQNVRQGLERGGQIRVGDTWWNGGGFRLMKYLKATPEQIRKIVEKYGVEYTPIFGDGDIKGLDLGIKRFFLELYTITGGLYYKFDDHLDERTYKIIVQHCLQAIAARVTHLYGDEWRIIKGAMPSGSYITSHGDSWIMMLMFTIFIQSVWEKNPHHRAEIDRCCRKLWINIVIYGDDHILRTIKKLSHLISETTFVNFLYNFFDLKSRDVRPGCEFLSVPDGLGGLKFRGLVFLKKYLIPLPDYMKRPNLNMPPYVPYRTIDSYYHRIAFGSNPDRDLLDQILSCIGNAFDSMGTNIHAYNFLRMMHAHLVSKVSVTSKSLRSQLYTRVMSSESKEITKLMRKSGITVVELVNDFPTLDLLVSKHAITSKGSFTKYPML